MSVADEARAGLEGITPGQWKYADIIDGLHNVISEMGWDIASCSDGGSGQGDRPRREAFAIRNAEFIAAAPDLVRGLLDELDQLQRWKDEALPVIAGLQELGRALGVPLGRSITGPESAVRAQALRAERDAAVATIQQVRELADRWRSALVLGGRLDVGPIPDPGTRKFGDELARTLEPR
ncbi:hypothetical protein BJD61_gp79 [Gordonia phage Obliviate]|uniref:hypothetical protein n=1 Tax=Gordonia phage Obliviate TaxID=1821559 RepID=UPI00078DFF50|nr:hypothetical protein BJD61_gp79 [Gordonia phage Obliviate]AMS03158.1 hypothetical protein SEA_OBLIVIATE_79 [Gordonia phage Obliviate]